MNQYKKLFAVLTLLCFALTLMPVAAFAAVTPSDSYVYTDDVDATVDAISTDKDGNKVYDWADICFDLEPGTSTGSMYVWFVKDGSNVAAESVVSKAGIKPVSGVFAMGKVEEDEKYSFAFDNTGKYTVHAALVNPLAKYNSGKFATKAEAFRNAEDELLFISSNQKTITVESDSDSNDYTLQLIDNADLPFGIAEGASIANGGKTTIGYGGNLSIEGVNNHLNTNGVASGDITFKVLDKDGKAVKGAKVKLSTSNANCIVNKETVTTDQLGQFKFTIAITEESPNIDGFTIYIECGSYEAKLQITASSTSAYDLTFTKMPQVALSTDDCTAGSYLDDIWVAVKDVNGNFVKPFTLQPGGKFAEPGFAGVLVSGKNHEFTSSYVNGDSQNNYKAWGKSAEDYVSIVSQPAGSKLENKDIWLCPVGQDAPYQNTLFTNKDLVAGEYTLKLTLANGKYKTITFSVAEMGTPVTLKVTPRAPATELGSKTSASFKLVDANGVGCDALKKGTDVAVTGYGVLETEIVETDNEVNIYTKNDDKYAGSEIKIIATNDRYNLVGESTIKINDGKAFIYIPVKEAKINTPTDITYLLMNGQTNMNVTIGNMNTDVAPYYRLAIVKNIAENLIKEGMDEETAQEKAETMVTDSMVEAQLPTGTFRVAGGQTSFVVIAKPEGATVNFDARAAGGAITSITGDSYAVGRIECDKPGVVTVQMSMGIEVKQADGTWAPHYYTGTQNIVFTDGSAGKTVVMSIGSSEIVIDGEKAVIDAAPVVQNSRTYVPFRALAEAFGAEVAYDEATQAVTAQLGNTTVVMTIGSATYTVNGEEKTADVAPFISGSRTMVPVRFAAEAFGSTVIPTYDDNGATADVLFKL